MKIRFRDECSPTGMKEEILFALWGITPVLEKYSRFVSAWWIWSVTDGKHGNKSLHYPGLAVDISQEWN